jgi:integrase/recombinase XerC
MLSHLASFERSLTLRGLAPSTIAEIRRDLVLLSEHLSRPLETLTLADIEAGLLSLNTARSLKNVSLNRKISSVRLFFRFLHDRGSIPVNPAENLSFARRIRAAHPFSLTREQVHELLAVSRECPFHHTIIRTLYELGLRPAELISLQIADVDSSAMEIKVFGKGRTVRRLPFSRDLLILLRQAVRTHKGYRKSGPLFARYDGSPLTPSFLQHIIAHHTRKAGLHRRVSPKVFRHSHATHALEAGVDLFQIKNTLGHSDLSTTLKYTCIARATAHKAHRQFLSYALAGRAGP